MVIYPLRAKLSPEDFGWTKSSPTHEFFSTLLLEIWAAIPSFPPLGMTFLFVSLPQRLFFCSFLFYISFMFMFIFLLMNILKGGGYVLHHYGGSLIKALMDIYPTIGIEERKFQIVPRKLSLPLLLFSSLSLYLVSVSL